LARASRSRIVRAHGDGRASTGLAALNLAAKVGVFDLDATGELARLLAQQMGSMTLCLRSHAVGKETLRCRSSCSAETLFLACVIRCMVRNHVGRGSLLDSKTVPLTTLHW